MILWGLTVIAILFIFCLCRNAKLLGFGVLLPLIALSLLLLLIGAPMIATGAYYSRWEKVFDVSGRGCEELRTITPKSPIPENALVTPINFTVAYVGDTGANDHTIDNYEMIIAEGAQALFLLGDFDYCDDPTLWGTHLNATFGSDFPIIPIIGNHELHMWDDYADILGQTEFWANIESRDDITCGGTVWVNYWCIFRGIFVSFSSVGTKCGGYWDQTYHQDLLNSMFDTMLEITSNTSEFGTPFVNCIWHKNHQHTQLGGRTGEVNAPMYDTCMRHGAMIFNGHDHTFGRTHAFRDIENPTIVKTCSKGDQDCVYDLQNASISVISGLGGWELGGIRDDEKSESQWATTYREQFGATFCVYNYNGQEDLVYCYWKNIDGQVIDEWFVRQRL